MKEWLKENWLLVFLGIMLILAAGAGWKLFIIYREHFGNFFPTDKGDRSSWGTLGDFFGGTFNPILAFLSLVMLLVTLYQNQRELSLSRKEFKDSAQALRLQADTLQKQRFEDTFFALLDQHNRILDRILEDLASYENQENSNYGRTLTRIMRERIIGGGYEFRIESKIIDLKEAKTNLLNNTSPLNQYYRVLYQLLKFVASSCPESTIKGDFSRRRLRATNASSGEKVYTNIIRALLPDDVTLLLAINCYHEGENDSSENYKLLVERYAFFEQTRMPQAINYNLNLIAEIASYYENNAFGDNHAWLHAKQEKHVTVAK